MINKHQIIDESEQTVGLVRDIKQDVKHIYSPDEIKNFNLETAINNSPLLNKPTPVRVKLAYSYIKRELHPTKKYLMPGQLVLFNYMQPKHKEDLQYYDRTPLTLFIGMIRTKDGNIRELGFNLHYYPPFARARMLIKVYDTFKPWFDKYFNKASDKPYTIISQDRLTAICNINKSIEFGLKMYVPTLRMQSYVIPTRLFATAVYTEGNFSKATVGQIHRFWRRFRYMK